MGRHLYGNDSNDEPPSTELFVPYRWASTYGTLYYSNGGSTPSSTSTPLTYSGYLVVGDNNWTNSNLSDTLAGNKTYQDQAKGPNLNCGPEMTPLINDYATLQYNTSLLNAFNRGGSNALIGLSWGYYAISPKWRGLWGGSTPSTLPGNYSSHQTTKTVIIISDGDNNWSDWTGYTKSATTASQYIAEIGQTAWNSIVGYWNNGQHFNNIYVGAPGSPVASYYPDSDFTAYGRLSQSYMGTTNLTTAINTANSRMLTMCTAMKNNGITIYGIAYGSDATASIKSTLTSCASTGKYTWVSNPATLQSTLTAIQPASTTTTYVRLIK